MVNTLLENHPGSFIPVYYQLSSAASQPWCNTRADFFSILYTPTLWFDGVLNGHNNTQWWETNYQNERARTSDVTLTGSARLSGAQLDVDSEICIEVGGAAQDLRIYTLQLLDHYPDTETYYRNCFRQVKIETITVAGGACASVSTSMGLKSLDESRPEDVRVVVWAQEDFDSSTADIFQATEFVPLITIIHTSDFEDGNLDGWDWAFGS